MNRRTLIDRLADVTALDGVATVVRDAVHKVLKPGPVKDALHGVWLGHAVHPALAQVPVGCFTGATLLDLTGYDGGAQRRLIAAGLLASAPAAAAGLADNAESHEEHQRIGMVHAALNSIAAGCYATSFVLRGRGRRAAGVATGLAGFTFAMVSATIGGDLAFRHAVGANHAADAPHTGPDDWCDLGPVDDFSANQPVRRMAGQVPVLVLHDGTGYQVLNDRCTHMAGPMHEGTLSDEDGDRCLTCPWHGSVFRISDGAVVHGPATAPLPVLDSKVVAGRLQAKVRTYPGVPAS